MGEMRNA